MNSHARDDGFHEIQLNGKQLVFVFMAATVVSVVIFLCGVLVGRGVRVERADLARVSEPSAVDQLRNAIEPGKPPTVQASEDPTKAPPPAPAEGGTANLDGPADAAATGGVAAAAKAADAAAAVVAKPATSAPAPKPTTAPATPATAPAGGTPAPAAGAGTSAPVAAVPKDATAKEAPARAKSVDPSPSAPRAARQAAAADAPASVVPAPDDTRQGWMVQVAATKTRDEADGIAKRLSSKGYTAFVLTNSANVFRVRVGGYRSKRDADAVAAKLRKEERVNPWVTR